MRTLIFTSLTATFFLASGLIPAHAQERIYRCGNVYTNAIPPGQKANCKLMEGGNVTVVERPRNSVRMAAANENAPRVQSELQRTRDIESRQILESELRKAQDRRDELLKAYNNGEPEKMGPEARNYQKYLDRVASIKSDIERNENDMAGLRRELDRLPESK